MQIKTIILTILVKLLNIARFIAKGLYKLIKLVFKPFIALIVFVIKPLVLKSYKYYLLIKSRLDKSPLLKSKIGLVLYNRYLIHVMLAIIAITVASTNILQATEIQKSRDTNSQKTSEEIIEKANFQKTKQQNYINTDGLIIANVSKLAEKNHEQEIAFSSNTSSLIATAVLSTEQKNNTVSESYLQWPVDSRNAPTTYYGHVNNARDFPCPVGTPIYAAESGTANISFTGYGHGYGNAIDLSSDNGLMTRYAHMSSFNVSDGQYVNRGDVIGFVGMTGRTSGPHLHFEIWINGMAYNPLNYLY